MPNNRWTIVMADTYSAMWFWLTFLAVIGAALVRGAVRSVRRRLPTDGHDPQPLRSV
jgi:hypothetical protein